MAKWILPLLILVSQWSFAEEVELVNEVPTKTVVAAPAPTVPAADAVTTEPLPKATIALKETEIPVRLENEKKSAATDSPWMRMLMGLAVVGILACGSWVFVKRAKSADRRSSLAPEIKVLAQHHLGPKRTLAIIRVAGESILLGVTDSNINLIKSLSLLDEEIPETVPQNFDAVFSIKNELDSKTSKEDQEDFSISGIKDVVTNRLKNMRNFQ